MAPARERVSIRAFGRDDLPALERHMPSPYHQHRVAAREHRAATFVLAWSSAPRSATCSSSGTAPTRPSSARHTGRCPELNGITVTAARPLARDRHGADRGGAAPGRLARRRAGRARYRRGGPLRPRLYERLGYRAWEHGTFDASWQAPHAPGGREHETYVYLLKGLFAAS